MSHPINPIYLPGAKVIADELMTAAFGGRTSVTAEKIDPRNIATVDIGAAPTTVEPVETERDWIFTFGTNHRAYSVGSVSAAAAGAEGFPLKNRYVIIHGTREAARDRIVEIFGQAWASQYGSRQAAGVDEYGLTELVIA